MLVSVHERTLRALPNLRWVGCDDGLGDDAGRTATLSGRPVWLAVLVDDEKAFAVAVLEVDAVEGGVRRAIHGCLCLFPECRAALWGYGGDLTGVVVQHSALRVEDAPTQARALDALAAPAPFDAVTVGEDPLGGEASKLTFTSANGLSSAAFPILGP